VDRFIKLSAEQRKTIVELLQERKGTIHEARLLDETTKIHSILYIESIIERFE
jgi:hypothetical protein